MSRLLAALRRIEARTDTIDATAASHTVVEQRSEDDRVDAISLPRESPVWPGDIVYDPQPEYPGHWTPRAAADWPSVSHESEAGYAESAPWPDLGFGSTPEASIADGSGTEVLEESTGAPVEDMLVRDPAVVEARSEAEALDSVQTIIRVEPESPSEDASATLSGHNDALPDSLAAESLLLMMDQQPDAVAVSVPSTSVLEAAPNTAEILKTGIGKHFASFSFIDAPSAVDPHFNEQALASPPTSDEVAEEPVISVRLPGFGRPNRRGRVAGQATAGERNRRPALVPFLPPAQRPYREACESILSALPQGNSVALILAWVDEDLDHCVLSARLAEVMADRLDDPVLLIDMGPKRHLSTLLQAPAIGSLTEAMVGFVSWRDQIVQTDTAGLCLLPSGPHDFEADPVAVARLFEACKEDFAIVLVVGGALSDIPENILMASDAAVLMVEAGHTTSETATSAIGRLRRSGTDVAGCLLTGAAGGY